MFYDKDEFDPNNHSLDPVWAFKPFCDYFASWFPPGVKDKDYLIAQYDGALAYMDACITNIFATIDALGIWEDTLLVFDADHGETLYDHDCFFDHHSIYDVILHIPLVFYHRGKVAPGRFGDHCQMKDIVPTILDLLGVETEIKFDGRSLTPLMRGEPREEESEFYITEATWMRKHGWRTPEWKLIVALEPDFHFKPEVELYNLVDDPDENNNLAQAKPQIVKELQAKMEAHIARREKETGRTNPMYTNLDWHGREDMGPFKSSQQAYETLHIGTPEAAEALQAKELQTQRGQKEL